MELADPVARENLLLCVSALPMKERRSVELKFGLTGDNPWTIEEIGFELGMTIERTHETIQTALRKLKRVTPVPPLE